MRIHKSSSTFVLCVLAQLGLFGQTQARALEAQAYSQSELSVAAVGSAAASSIPAESRNPTTPLRYPYVVSLRNSATSAYVCGGALVDAEYVLTAAQCISTGGPVYVEVSSPSYANHEKIGVVNILYHSNWNGDIISGHDIALLKLEYPSSAPPVKLPKWRTKIADRENLALLSRGRTSTSGSFSDTLQIGRIEFFSTSECSEISILGDLIQPGMMCLGGGGARACVGDEGSPVVRVGSTKEDLLLGITSIFNKQDCSIPVGIYTRVDEYKSWISSIL